MRPRSHTWQHNQIWARGTEDTILSLIKGSFYVSGRMVLLEMVAYYKKTEMYVSLNQKNREMTMLKQNSYRL